MIERLVRLVPGARGSGASAARPAVPELAVGLAGHARPFEGEWKYLGPYRPFSFRISGTTGVCTLSNAPDVYSVGDTMLHLDTVSDRSFTGRLMYTDGKFRQMRGVLTEPDRLDLSLVVAEPRVVPDAVLYRR